MAIAVSDRAVAEIKKAAAAAGDAAEGAARRHPRRRLHGLLLSVRVVGQEPRAEDKVLAFEDGAVRVFVDPKSFLYLDGSTLEYQTTMMGRGLQVQEPEREGDVRLRRERPVLTRRGSMRCCWSCETRRRGSGAARASACGALQPPDDDGGSVRRARAARALRGRSGGGRGGVQGSVAAGAPRSVRDRRSARAPRVAGAHRPAERRLADDEGSGAARGVSARRARASTSAASNRRHGGEERRTMEVAAPPAFLMEILELRDELAAARARGRHGARSRSWPRRCGARARESMKTHRRRRSTRRARAAGGGGARAGRAALLPALPRRGVAPGRTEAAATGGRGR